MQEDHIQQPPTIKLILQNVSISNSSLEVFDHFGQSCVPIILKRIPSIKMSSGESVISPAKVNYVYTYETIFSKN